MKILPIVTGTVVVWIAVTVFCLIPKKLTPFDLIFLFFMDTVFELGTISIFQTNLKWMVVGPSVDMALADLMFRLIELPLLLVTTSNLLLYSNRLVKWGGVSTIVLFSMAVQKVLVWHGMLIYRNWNILYTAIYLVVFVAFSRVMAWFILRTSPEEAL
ncbi:hypothetical protein LLE49_17005 [Alicyclobacillus tolerans]|uniref:hypothetical protein n=1 Tax=Alicyclobacillus tolerans TaxID=90970 RepID=UPI001F375947|nr:hypothetical protein [Alicyclobacillus tolerans]MCF8566423.1 hypothetical protein [Alicyclobacillus tolerans]